MREKYMKERSGMPKSRGERGLTLIEVIIVLIIVGSIGAYVANKVFNSLGRANAMQTRTIMMDIKGSILQFQALNSQLPSDLRSAGVVEEKDKWGMPIQYRQLDGGRSYELLSLGADKKPGGTGNDEDIVVTGP